jgi:hypothetical protein
LKQRRRVAVPFPPPNIKGIRFFLLPIGSDLQLHKSSFDFHVLTGGRAQDIGYQTSKRRDLPRFGTLLV